MDSNGKKGSGDSLVICEIQMSFLLASWFSRDPSGVVAFDSFVNVSKSEIFAICLAEYLGVCSVVFLSREGSEERVTHRAQLVTS